MVNRLIPPPTRLTNEVQEVQVFFILVEYVINQLFLIPAHHIIVLTAYLSDRGQLGIRKFSHAKRIELNGWLHLGQLTH